MTLVHNDELVVVLLELMELLGEKVVADDGDEMLAADGVFAREDDLDLLDVDGISVAEITSLKFFNF